MAYISLKFRLEACFLLWLLLSFTLFTAGARHAKHRSQIDIPGQRLWCIAKPSVDDHTLLVNLNFTCSQPGVDCSILRIGCPCFYPNTPVAHASIAMNMYFQHYGRNYWNCYFNDTGLVILTDPSFGLCKYSYQ